MSQMLKIAQSITANYSCDEVIEIVGSDGSLSDFVRREYRIVLSHEYAKKIRGACLSFLELIEGAEREEGHSYFENTDRSHMRIQVGDKACTKFRFSGEIKFGSIYKIENTDSGFCAHFKYDDEITNRCGQ